MFETWYLRDLTASNWKILDHFEPSQRVLNDLLVPIYWVPVHHYCHTSLDEREGVLHCKLEMLKSDCNAEWNSNECL